MTEPVSHEGRAAYSVPAGKRYTYQEYLQLNDELRYELAEGELRVVPAPGIEHQEIVGNLYWLLAQYVRETRAGKVLVAPVDVYLDARQDRLLNGDGGGNPGSAAVAGATETVGAVCCERTGTWPR